MYWFLVPIGFILLFSFILDLKRKNMNNAHNTNPNAKPGDSTNYMMGDNKYTNGG